MDNKILILPGLLILFLGLFATPAFSIGSEDDGGNYLGPDGCKSCHAKNFDNWANTNHSKAYESLEKINQQENQDCLPCHTTGYNSETGTYKFKDITCEACHNSGDLDSATKKSMVKNLSSEMCGRCHQERGHNPTYEEWRGSKHARSLIDLKEDKNAKDECLGCHSSEFNTGGMEKPTLETATLGNTCSACHNSHGPENGKLLRMPRNKICESCHNMNNAKPGQVPHVSQKEMRFASGGVDTDVYIYQQNVGCVDCHRFSERSNISNGKKGITGHTFEINYTTCLNCHEGFPSEAKAMQYVRTEQAKVMERYNGTLIKMKEAEKVVNKVNGSEKNTYFKVYNDALFNIQMVSADRSKGAHNPGYAEELINKADFKAQNIIAGQPTGSLVYGIGIMALLTGFILIIYAGLSLWKKEK
jgi:predicted CXXCH cytochrome family protein